MVINGRGKIVLVILAVIFINCSVAIAGCNHTFENLQGDVWKCSLCGKYVGGSYVGELKRNREISDMKQSIDQIYSMVCDLETKFMGNDRMEQITNPDHIPETVRQELMLKNKSNLPKEW